MSDGENISGLGLSHLDAAACADQLRLIHKHMKSSGTSSNVTVE